MGLLLTALALLSAAAPARAIELSLEENRSGRGGVGFVDMRKVFADSPDAAREKESFEAVVRQAEERVNLKKAELVKLRQDLAAAKTARETLAKSPTPPLAPPPALSTAAAPGVAASTAPAAAPKPGVTASTAPAAGLKPAVAASTTTAVAVSTTAAAEPPSAAQQMLELDGKIISLQADILRREAELTRERSDTDRGLIDIESRKTDQVLARLYRVISEVARQEGVTIVVDKSAILYGHQGVDLTDKVLKALRSQTP